jgi:leucyl aminopeptidase
MKITVTDRNPNAVPADCLVFLSEGGLKLSVPSGESLTKTVADYARAVKAGRIKRMSFAPAPPRSKSGSVILSEVCMGKRKNLPRCERYRYAAAEIYKHCQSGGLKKAAFVLNGTEGPAVAKWIAEGISVAAYSYRDYKKKPDTFSSRFSAEALVDSAALDAVKAGVKESLDICECVAMARDLINKPGSVAGPLYLAQAAASLAAETALDCEIWDETRLAEEGFTGLLAVGKGGTEPPRMAVLRYRPEGHPGGPHLCLVGKGLTFDTGGLCLKDGAQMWQMVSDMSGAAAVLAAMKAITLTRPGIPVTGIMVCSQNYPDAKSVLPGDCIVAKNGKGIHILNTDAEGRLILSDGLARAGEEGATHIVDIATLTGACVRALGDSLTGLFSNDEQLAQNLFECGAAAGEDMWRLPLYQEYLQNLDHYRADINNTGKTPNGGAIHGALFLQEFVPKNTAWAHLDIAGTAFSSSRWRYFDPGARGVMVRMLASLAHKMAGK